MTKDEAKAFVNSYEQRNIGFGTVLHPEFDDFTLSTLDDLESLWFAVSTGFPQFKDIADMYHKAIRRRDSKLKKMEERLSEHNNQFSPTTPAKKIVNAIKKLNKYPEEMKLSFNKGRLCVNLVPTVIKERDLRHLYNGMMSLIGEKEAVDMVVKAITNKLDDLFKETAKITSKKNTPAEPCDPLMDLLILSGLKEAR